jgi:hypothetical protein
LHEDRLTVRGAGLEGATVLVGGVALENAAASETLVSGLAPAGGATGERAIVVRDANGCESEAAVRVRYVESLRVEEVFPSQNAVAVALSQIKACFNREIAPAPEEVLQASYRGDSLSGTQSTQGKCVVLLLHERFRGTAAPR